MTLQIDFGEFSCRVTMTMRGIPRLKARIEHTVRCPGNAQRLEKPLTEENPMRTSLITIVLIVSSTLAAQEQAATTPINDKAEEAASENANVSFRWLERAHQEELTFPAPHRTICPACPANHVSFAHKESLGVVRHMTGLHSHPSVRSRCAVEITMDDSGSIRRTATS